ncbi:MAG: trigger factor [Akkermansia sp.]
MEITINKTSDCQATLQATATPAEVSAVKDSVIAAYASGARIPGFRPGKAPKSVIIKRYAEAIKDELDLRMQNDIQEKALEENPELKVLDFGKPECGEQADGSYSLSSTLTIVPSFELPEYMGIEVTVPSTEVSDAEVEETMKRYAEASAKHEVVERAAAMGDIAVIDFKTTVEGKPAAEFCGKPLGFMEGREGHWQAVEADSFMPGLGEGLVGLSAGDSKSIAVTMKEDFPIAELAGKTVDFAVTVKEVREKVVPEISTELFAESMPGKTLEEIKELVRENMKSSKERANEESKADQISEKLAEQLSFALPADLVERENENTVQRKVYAAIQSGNYDIAKDMDKLREESKAETERNLRVYFALQEIASKEHIMATDQEVLGTLMDMAEKAKEKNLKAFIRKMQRENRITGVRLSIVTSKVLDLLARNAKVSAPEA